MTVILAQLFSKADSEEIDKICYLSLGRLGPKFAATEFNLAEKMMIRVLAQAYGQNEKEITKAFKKIGDLGEVASKLIKKKTSLVKLSVSQVYDRLEEIATESGEGSVERKIKKMACLLTELNPLSAKYVIRIPLTKLRLGFSDMTILDALSWMMVSSKSKRMEIDTAYYVRADVGVIAKTIKKKGLKGLKKLNISLGTPIIPALCQRLPTAEKMIEKMGRVAVEPKYDGQRLQIHYSRKMTEIFTRNLDNVTPMFPDIVKAISKEVKAKSVILDGEAIGINSKTGKFLPFQETIKRKRKHLVALMVKEIPLQFICFDILYKNGRDLLKTPFSKRRAILEKTMTSKAKTIILAPQIVTDNPQVIKEYHEKQLKNGLEGAVLKKWKAPYDPGKRGYTWVKLKQEKGKKGGGLADTLDCVVMGYYRGKGRRAIFGIGAFLVGVRRGNSLVTISKIGTGLTDVQWQEMKKRCDKVIIKKPPREFKMNKNLTSPDILCSPAIVVEIEADNITISSLHSAGYALRFPRLVRFREDKNPDQITTLKETEKLYNMQ
jgi:DNA ligase-1